MSEGNTGSTFLGNNPGMNPFGKTHGLFGNAVGNTSGNTNGTQAGNNLGGGNPVGLFTGQSVGSSTQFGGNSTNSTGGLFRGQIESSSPFPSFSGGLQGTQGAGNSGGGVSSSLFGGQGGATSSAIFGTQGGAASNAIFGTQGGATSSSIFGTQRGATSSAIFGTQGAPTASGFFAAQGGPTSGGIFGTQGEATSGRLSITQGGNSSASLFGSQGGNTVGAAFGSQVGTASGSLFGAQWGNTSSAPFGNQAGLTSGPVVGSQGGTTASNLFGIQMGTASTSQFSTQPTTPNSTEGQPVATSSTFKDQSAYTSSSLGNQVANTAQLSFSEGSTINPLVPNNISGGATNSSWGISSNAGILGATANVKGTQEGSASSNFSGFSSQTPNMAIGNAYSVPTSWNSNLVAPSPTTNNPPQNSTSNFTSFAGIPTFSSSGNTSSSLSVLGSTKLGINPMSSSNQSSTSILGQSSNSIVNNPIGNNISATTAILPTTTYSSGSSGTALSLSSSAGNTSQPTLAPQLPSTTTTSNFNFQSSASLFLQGTSPNTEVSKGANPLITNSSSSSTTLTSNMFPSTNILGSKSISNTGIPGVTKSSTNIGASETSLKLSNTETIKEKDASASLAKTQKALIESIHHERVDDLLTNWEKRVKQRVQTFTQYADLVSEIDLSTIQQTQKLTDLRKNQEITLAKQKNLSQIINNIEQQQHNLIPILNSVESELKAKMSNIKNQSLDSRILLNSQQLQWLEQEITQINDIYIKLSETHQPDILFSINKAIAMHEKSIETLIQQVETLEASLDKIATRISK